MKARVRTERVARLLEDLLGRKVAVKTIPAFDLSATDSLLTALYENAEGVPVAVVVCDLEFVLNAGAALCLIPLYEVQKNEKAKTWEPSLVENFKEVLNICARLFGELESYRIRLGTVCLGKEPRSPQALQLLAKPAWRTDIQLTIAGYAGGRMAIVE